MEVKKGFKKTEIGIIPNDWEISTLGKCCSKIVDGTHFTPIYQTDGIPFISVENITGNNLDNTKFISVREHKKLIQRCKPQLHDILMTRIGSLGETKYVTWETEFSIYVSLVLLRPADETLGKFLYEYSKSHHFKKEIEKRSLTNATPQKINMGDIKYVSIPVPSEKLEQKAIAEVLSDVDALINALDALIAKKRAIKQGVMQELLTGKRRLPGFNGEWEQVKLGDITKINTGKKNNDDKIENGKYPFFVRSQIIEKINTYSFDGEAILIPGEGGIGNIYHYINGKFDYHQRVYKISDFHFNVYGKFVYYVLTQKFYDHAMRNTVKATVDSLRLPTFQKFEFLIPSNLQEQEKIVEIISDIDFEINTLELERDKIKALKQGMMQELLTGHIRLMGG